MAGHRLLASRARDPNHIAGWNNLASLLLERGCSDVAGQAIERAVTLAGEASVHADVLAATRDEIAAASRDRSRRAAQDCRGLP